MLNVQEGWLAKANQVTGTKRLPFCEGCNSIKTSGISKENEKRKKTVLLQFLFLKNWFDGFFFSFFFLSIFITVISNSLIRKISQGLVNVVRKLKAHLELNLMWDVKGNMATWKAFKCPSAEKGRPREMYLLLNGTEAFVTKDMGKAELLNAFFSSFLWRLVAFRNPRPLRPEEKSAARNTYPSWRRIRSENTYTNWT